MWLSSYGKIMHMYEYIPRRSGGNIIIDKQGIVRHIFSSQFAPQKHVTEALKVLKELSDENK